MFLQPFFVVDSPLDDTAWGVLHVGQQTAQD
jgi:hypothetical protein